jgi:hypothetical protein
MKILNKAIAHSFDLRAIRNSHSLTQNVHLFLFDVIQNISNELFLLVLLAPRVGASVSKALSLKRKEKMQLPLSLKTLELLRLSRRLMCIVAYEQRGRFGIIVRSVMIPTEGGVN